MAFIAFTIKMLVVNVSIADSIALAVLAGLYGYSQYLNRFQPFNLDEAVKKDLIEVKSALSKLNLAQATEKATKKQYF